MNPGRRKREKATWDKKRGRGGPTSWTGKRRNQSSCDKIFCGSNTSAKRFGEQTEENVSCEKERTKPEKTAKKGREEMVCQHTTWGGRHAGQTGTKD